MATFTITMEQTATGLWQWRILRNGVCVESDKTDGDRTEAQCREVASAFLYDHVAYDTEDVTTGSTTVPS
jgi:hypothetical protein